METKAFTAHERLMIVKKKKEALLKAGGLFLWLNAGLLTALFLKWLLGLKPGPVPRPPGGFYTIEIILLIVAFLYYLTTVRRYQDKDRA